MFPQIILILLFYWAWDLLAVDLRAQINANSHHYKTTALLQDQLFTSNDILHLKLTANLNALFNDRNNKGAVYHPMRLQYFDKDSNGISLELKVRTRGNFRRKKENCKIPPLMLNFSRQKTTNTIFEDQNKLKLVMPCNEDDYVIREWLVYQLYHLVTEKSFNARLASVEFEDSANRRKTETYHCILLEDEARLAARNGAFVWNRSRVAMTTTDKELFLKMAVFQFMIGNTDWSVPYLQNITLISKDSFKAPYPVPYDFDHAGIVSAPYALPAAELEMASVLERRYRGYCQNKINYASVIKFFNTLRDKIFNLYTTCPLLSSRYVKFVTKYLNDFYKIINNDKLAERQFAHPCKQTSRIEIKGLKER